MQLLIKGRDNNELGLVETDNNQVKLFGDHNESLADFVIQSQKTGITRVRDVYDSELGSFTMVVEPVERTDPSYALAFKEFLERSGYDVVEKHPEVEEEIRKFLAEFPVDNPDKLDILQRLPEMSYLEQTAILEGLKNLD